MNNNLKSVVRISGIVGVILLALGCPFLLALFGGPSVALWITLGVALIGIAAYIIFEIDTIIAFVNRRSVKKATTTFVYMFLTLAILIVLYIICMNFPLRFDVTADKAFSMSEQSRETARMVDKRVDIYVFRDEARQGSSIEWHTDALLREYKAANRNIKVDYIDPYRQVAKRNEFKVQQYGEIVLALEGENGRRSIRIMPDDLQRISYERGTPPTFLGEQKFASALYSLFEAESLTVYFTEGHGEADIKSAGQTGLSHITAALEAENYRVEPLSTLRGAIPEDASLIVIAGPKTPFTVSEIAALNAYLEKGGKIIALYDPSLVEDNRSNLDEFFAKWGIELINDFIVDPMNSLPENPMALIPEYGAHVITAPLKNEKLSACFFNARSVREGRSIPRWILNEIVTTSEIGYSKRSTNSLAYRAGYDIAGPIPFCVVGKYPVGESENPIDGKTNVDYGYMAVYGDSDFIKNHVVREVPANADLFLNTVAFCAEVDKKVTIRPKTVDRPRISLTRNQSTLVTFFVQFLIPLLFAALGIVVWFTRRN